MRYLWILPALLLALLPLAGCSDRPADDEDLQAEQQAHDEGHHHGSLRGGTMVELGAHVAQVDFYLDADTGTLSAFVMDGHAQNYVRLKAASLPVVVTIAGEDLHVELKAVADPLSGETVGDTSRFEAQVDALRDVETFSGRLERITVYGETFRDVSFTYEAE